MTHLIKNRRIVTDSWLLLDGERWLRAGEDGFVPDFPVAAALIVPVALWRGRRGELLDRGGPLGVRLDGGDAPEIIAADLRHFDLVAVEIRQFSDGRAHTLGRLLRERYGFRGELRAAGDVLRDQLLSLEQCGFDAFALRGDQDANETLLAFNDFTEAYQASVTQPAPLFRRRAVAVATP